MADGLSFPRFRAAWASAGPAWKFLWVMVFLSLFAFAGAFLWLNVGQQEFRVLYAELSDKDGGEVVEALEKLRIPYHLPEPGGTIEVPASQLHMARYKLAVQGLPKGDRPAAEPPGLRFGLSSFQEQASYQRALEVELARSMEVIAGIESARVHLALPKQSSFLREQTPPSASVLLRLKPAAVLAPEQARAVRQIVASSVPGMLADRVNVIDQHGALDAAMPADSAEPAASMPQALPPAFPVTASPANPPMQAATPVPERPERPARRPQDMQSWLDEWLPSPRREAMLGLLLATFVLWLWLRVRARRQSEQLMQTVAAQEAQNLEARLEQLRQRVTMDPRVAASVIKLWMQKA